MLDVPQILLDLHAFDRFGDDGIEQCPICGRAYSMEVFDGAVHSADGRSFETYIETDPVEDWPYYCDECWDVAEMPIRYLYERHSHITLENYMEIPEFSHPGIEVTSGHCPECDDFRVFIKASAYRGDEAEGWCCRNCTARFGKVMQKEEMET